MPQKIIFALVGAAAILLPTTSVNADLIQVQATGQVQFTGPEVSSFFTPGDLLSISWSYDTAALPIDVSNLENRANYLGDSLIVQINGNTWSDTPEVTVFNDDVPDVSDRIEVNGFSPSGPDLPGGLSINQITLRLGFGGATDIYDTTALPTGPELQQLTERDDFDSLGSLDFGGIQQSVFFSFANVNVQSVPEPTGLPMLLCLLGSLSLIAPRSKQDQP